MLIKAQFSPAYSNFFGKPFEFMGWICPAGGAVDLIIAIFLYGYKKNSYGHGFFISAALLLTIGYIANH